MSRPLDDVHVRGSAVVYRMYDVGYAIALDHADRLLEGMTAGRTRPARNEAQAIQIRNPPLLAALGSCDVTVAAERRSAALTAHIFDFGVCSLHLRIAAPPSPSWRAFSDFGGAVGTSPDIGPVFDQALDTLLKRIAPAVERPGVAPLSEEYIVFRIDRLERDNTALAAAELLHDEDLVPLLLGETRSLSPAARRELLPHRFSYYADDLAVLTWDNALVVEPRAEDRDVEYVLEFANAQLLEFRVFDYRLDAELPALYDRAAVARARRWPRPGTRFRVVLSDLQTLLADVTETVERVENALKWTDDVYLARIYSAALDLFRGNAWQQGIERKLGILRETYELLHDEAQTARAELLEIAIVFLIVAEIVLGLFRRL